MKYVCKYCVYSTNIKTNYNRHCTSIKHIRNTGGDTKLHDQVNQISDDLKAAIHEIHDLKTKPQSVVNNYHKHNVTLNIFFNEDLEYFSELVKKLGIETACTYLLQKHPDQFDALEKIFENTKFFPIGVHRDGFVIYRAKDKYNIDPTGHLIDKENKDKLTDAIIMAYDTNPDESIKLYDIITDIRKKTFKPTLRRKNWPHAATQIVIPTINCREITYAKNATPKSDAVPTSPEADDALIDNKYPT